MSWGIIIIIVFVLLVAIFWALQFISDKNYKPTKQEILDIIQKTIDGNIDLSKFDEFTSVRISYNRQLDAIREKYNTIVDNKEYFSESDITKENVAPLNEQGKNKLRILLEELNEIST